MLVHCLAGAHRAGTTGILCLMRYADMNGAEAVAAAKRLRPVIDPIGRFPQLISMYGTIRDRERQIQKQQQPAA